MGHLFQIKGALYDNNMTIVTLNYSILVFRTSQNAFNITNDAPGTWFSTIASRMTKIVFPRVVFLIYT